VSPYFFFFLAAVLLLFLTLAGFFLAIKTSPPN